MELFHCPQRQRDLLNLLLMTDEWISGRELSNKLNVSDRTIRKDIIELNDILNQYDSAILSERGKGYLLKSENRKYLLSTLNNNNRPDEKKNRIFEQCGIPLLRLRTDESGEETRIEQALQISMQRW